MKKLGIIFILILTTAINFANAEDNHETLVKLTPENIALAGIKVSTLTKEPMKRYLIVPGEVVLDQDQTAIIAPRIQAQVVKRLVNVGESVTQGQALVVLSSVAVAEAQAELLINANEWRRFKTLGTNIVTKKAYEEAEIKFRQAYAKLLAYGLTNDQIQEFIKSKLAHKANGDFTLLSPITGTVASADLVLGQMLDPGAKIYEITNENNLWVNALLSADNHYNIKLGSEAIIKTEKKSIIGKVIQVHHQLNTSTRTQIIRIAINNLNDEFHAGEFVTCHIAIGTTELVLVVPVSAIFQDSEGDNIVYVEKQSGIFEPREVKIAYQQNNKAVITGIESGIKIVTEGAFFINSEMRKSGFKAHNH